MSVSWKGEVALFVERGVNKSSRGKGYSRHEIREEGGGNRNGPEKSPRPGQPVPNRTLVSTQNQRLNPTTSGGDERGLASFETGGPLQSLPQ